ncbi:hypothetical protein HDU96_009359 [Phlyctochytrium bullatum]|nr:hypothetical protein HDU96_009359 [Phlyctochytrium bullatum]
MAVTALRSTLDRNKDNLKRARTLSSLGASPSPVQVRIEKIKIPRRKDYVPEGYKGMDEKDAEGFIKAEWMDYHKESPASEENRVVLYRKFSLLAKYMAAPTYILCSRKSHRGITWRVAKHSRCKVLVVDYRLAPEHVFPLALHDAISAYFYLIDPPKLDGNGPQPKKYKPSEVVIMGDSAGGGLSMATLLWLRDHLDPAMMPAGGALMSPWLDLTHSMPSFKLNTFDYLPEGSNDPLYINENRRNYYVADNSFLTNPYVSPVFAKEDTSRPLPPLYIQCGGVERLRDEILHFYSNVFTTSKIRLEIYDDMCHVFQMLAAMLRVAEVSLQRLGTFVQSVTTPPTSTDPAPSFERAMVRIANTKSYPEKSFSSDDARKVIETGFAVLRSLGSSGSGSGSPASGRPPALTIPGPVTGQVVDSPIVELPTDHQLPPAPLSVDTANQGSGRLEEDELVEAALETATIDAQLDAIENAEEEEALTPALSAVKLTPVS